MAMTINGSMGIWKALSEANLRLYQYNMERGRIILQGAAAQEAEREMARLDVIYDGRKESEYEAQINAIYNQKTALADISSSLTAAQKKIGDLRLALSELSSFAAAGNSDGFDAKLKEINDIVGSSTTAYDQPDNLIGNRYHGSWRSQTNLTTANGVDIQYKSQFLGSDYQIVTDDGRVLSYNPSSESVGDYRFENLTIDRNASNIQDGGRIVFTDSETGETIEGTLKMGGLGIGSSWMYGMESTSALSKEISVLNQEIAALKVDEEGNPIETLSEETLALIAQKEADITSKTAMIETMRESNKSFGTDAAASIKQAMKLLDKVALEYEYAGSMVTSAINGYDVQMSDLQRKYDEAAEETLNARTAARQALQVKADLLDKKFALSSTTSATLIGGLFSYESVDSKKTIYDILGGN